MLGGGHVRRRSIDASPCPRIKRKHSEIQSQESDVSKEFPDSPNKARIVEKSSIPSPLVKIRPLASESRESPKRARIVEKLSVASTSSPSLIKPKHALREQQSVDETVLVGEGEDVQSSCESRFRM